MRRRLLISLPVIAVAAVMAVSIGASVGAAAKKPDPAIALYKKNCGSCHVLAAAKTKGLTGPNLNLRKVALAQVRKQVTNGGHFMPSFKGKLTKKQIELISVFVSKNAGKG